jgi:hypothetical protein
MEFQDHVIKWLLEDENPPVKYLTLTQLLKKPESDVLVQKSKTGLMNYAVTKGILAHGSEFWEDDNHAYWKYTGKYWQVIFLGQFLADGRDPSIAKGVQELLKNRKWVIKGGGQCLTANLLTAFRRLGYDEHPVVLEETEVLAQRIVADKGIMCSAMTYSLLSRCYMALPKLLLCFGEIPEEKRTDAVNTAIKLIVECLLDQSVSEYVPGNRKSWQDILAQQPKRADLPPGQTVKAWVEHQRESFLTKHGLGTRVAKSGWYKFGFPLHYNSDILEAMYALAKIGTPFSSTLKNSLQVIEQKMTSKGVWNLDNSFNGKMWIDVEEKGRPSKWITHFALFVLRHFEG